MQLKLHNTANCSAFSPNFWDRGLPSLSGLTQRFLLLCFHDLRQSRKIFQNHLGPVIDARRAMVEHGANKAKQPVLSPSFDRWIKPDLLQFLMDSAMGEKAGTDELVSRVLMVNFAALHTTSLVIIISSSLIIVFHSCDIWSRRTSRTYRTTSRGNWIYFSHAWIAEI